MKMRNFSKLFGVLLGTAAGQGIGPVISSGLAPFMPVETAEMIGKLVEIALPVIGTYLAPANTPSGVSEK